MNSRINITVPKDVHTAVRVYGIERGMTMADIVVEALRRMLADEQRKTTTPTA
jgi:hypothetical protein